MIGLTLDEVAVGGCITKGGERWRGGFKNDPYAPEYHASARKDFGSITDEFQQLSGVLNPITMFIPNRNNLQESADPETVEGFVNVSLRVVEVRNEVTGRHRHVRLRDQSAEDVRPSRDSEHCTQSKTNQGRAPRSRRHHVDSAVFITPDEVSRLTHQDVPD